MLKGGVYDVTYGTLYGEGSARVRLQGGAMSGITDRGTTIEGSCQFDAQRRTFRFDVVATVPPNKTSITGLTTEASARRVAFRGEAPATVGTTRFSIDFAGRAVDIVARYSGPL